MTEGSPKSRRADHGAKVLVVDDEPLARRSLQAMLERGHYQVATAGSGPEALALFTDWCPELLLLDIQMPGMDGLELCRQIRTLPEGQSVPIIFLTADERPEVHAEAMRVKGDDFLRKPVLAPELTVRIRSLMRLKRLKAEVEAERDSLLDLQRQQEQLITFIVHDLKNPLTGIQLGLDLLEGSVHEPAAEVQLRRLRETAGYMGRMIGNILDIGRAEQVGMELHPTRFRVAPWLQELLAEVAAPGTAKSNRLTCICPEDLELEADAELLRRMLLNLLDNAFKYSPDKRPVTVALSHADAALRLEVRDEGPGIPAASRDFVFEKFARLATGERAMGPGSGLGLAFCRMVAEAHRGRIWVEDNPAGGSLFVAELPLPSRA